MSAQAPKPAQPREPAPVQIRELSPPSWPLTFPLMQVLRPHLTEESYLPRLRRQAAEGYRLAAAFLPAEGEAPVGLLGFRQYESLYRGRHLFIDDLVVSPAAQHSGAGRALMAWAAEQARQQGCAALVLNARPSAIPFYEKLGMYAYTSPAMVLDLVPGGRE